MKLRNKLYILKGLSADQNEAYVELLRDCEIYKAHFPDMPITPGVCIIQMATELLEEKLGVKLALKEVVNAKFLAVINPNETNEITYQFKKLVDLEEQPSDGNGANSLTKKLKATVEVVGPNSPFTKLSLVYTVLS